MEKTRMGLFLMMVVTAVGNERAAAAPLPLPPDSVTYFPAVMRGEVNEKHGLAWSWIGRDRDAWQDYQITWYYHWSTRPVAGVAAEFVPMLWSDWPSLKEQILRDVSREYCGFLLVANEPEFTTQADMTIEDLIVLIDWVAVMYPCAKIVAPQTHVCWYELQPPVPPCPVLGNERFTVEGFIRAYQATHEGANPPVYAWGLHYGDVRYWPERLAGLMRQLTVPERFWYTEFNFCPDNLPRFEEWLIALNQDERVQRYAYWTNLQETDYCVLAEFATGLPNERGRVYAGFGE